MDDHINFTKTGKNTVNQLISNIDKFISTNNTERLKRSKIICNYKPGWQFYLNLGKR